MLFKKKNDIKLVVSSCTNICKLFSGLIKQNRIKSDEKNAYADSLSVNHWCSRVFYNLNQTYGDATTTDSFVGANAADETIKILQLRTQLSLFMMQSVFEFDAINNAQASQQQQQQSQHYSDPMEEDVAPASQSTVSRGVIESLNFSSGKKVDSSLKCFQNLIEFVQRETKRLYDLIMSHQQQVEANSRLG